MFDLFDVVKLKRAIPGIPLPAGSQGTIVLVHDADPPAYEIEFPDAVNLPGGLETLGLYSVSIDDLVEGDNSWKHAPKHR